MLSRPSQGEVPVPSASTGNALDSYISGASIQKPTMAHSALLSALSGFGQMVTLGSDVGSAISGERSQGNIALHAGLNSINTELANVNTFGQKATDFVSNVAGSSLGLIPFAGEALFAGAGKVATPLIAKGVSKVAPTLAEKTIPKLTMSGIKKETLGQFGSRSVQLGTSFAGFMAPQEIEEAYDEKTNQFNYGKAAVGVAANGALGAFIPTGQYLAGLLGSRFVKEAALTSSEAAAKALKSGALTQKQHDWYQDYLKNPTDPELHARATEILQEQGVNPDVARHKVFVKLLDENDAANINKVTTDQLFSELDQSVKMAPSDYVIHNSVDKLRQNKEIANGLDGWIDHIDSELEKMPENLAKAEDGMMIGIKDHMDFSEQGIYKDLKKSQFEESHTAHIPYTIPDNVLKHIKTELRIKQLMDKYDVSKNKQTLRRIEELKANQPKLMTPKEELEHIYAKTTNNKNFKMSKEYHRLVELSHYWPQARKLLDRVHLEDAHNAQRSYRNILKAYSDLIKSDLVRLANPERVKEYLKSQIESATLKANPNKDIKFTSTTKESSNEEKSSSEAKAETGEGKEKGEKGTNEDVLSAQREEAEASSAEESKDAYEASDKRLRQFKNSGKALENLISCVMGSTNGNI